MTEVLILIEVIVNGLMAGVLYSLVALGFVLIFKASGVFNYAQGVMALFAAMTLVGLQTGQVPFSHLIRAPHGARGRPFRLGAAAVRRHRPDRRRDGRASPIWSSG